MIRPGEPLGDWRTEPPDDTSEARWAQFVAANEDDIETEYKVNAKNSARYRAEFRDVWTHDDLEAAYYQVQARREREKRRNKALDALIQERTGK